MVITSLEYGFKNRVKVFIEEEYAFLLYSSDIKKYDLEVQKVVSEELIKQIIEETVFRRAKQKAMAILKRMDRTEFELREKLKHEEYVDEIIERTIEYVKSYHYIDDKRYLENYIRVHQAKKSIRQIKQELKYKGIALNDFNVALEVMDDQRAIERAIQKKMKNKKTLDVLQKQKLITYLYQKGFTSDDIKHAVQSLEQGIE